MLLQPQQPDVCKRPCAMPATLSTGTINELLYEADKTDQIHNVVEQNIVKSS